MLKRSKNVHLKDEWVKQCLQFLQNLKDLSALSKPQLLEEIYNQFLVSDYTQNGTGRLPDDVTSLHNTTIAGPLVLQVSV